MTFQFIKLTFTLSSTSANVDPSEITLSCSFWNTESNDIQFLGQCRVSLESIFSSTQEPQPVWIPLSALDDDAGLSKLMDSKRKDIDYPKELLTIIQGKEKSLKFKESKHVASEKSECNQCAGFRGAIRIQASHVQFAILSRKAYQDFLDVVEKDDFKIVHIFGKVCAGLREQVAQLLFTIYQDSFLDLFGCIAKREIMETGDSKSLFRTNSMTTKAADIFQRYYGTTYLKQALEEPLRRVVAYSKPYEIDPARNGKEENLSNLIELISIVADVLLNTQSLVPPYVTLCLSNSHK